MFRPNGYLDDPNHADDINDAVAMATKEIQFYKNGGSPFITVSALPAPEPEPKDVHFYHYHPNGSPRNGHPGTDPSLQHAQSYVVIGTIEYGRLTSIDPSRSSPGVNGLPSRVLSELQSVYASVPSAMVIVMNNNGKFTIQAQLVSQQQENQMGLGGHQQQQQQLLPPPQPIMHNPYQQSMPQQPPIVQVGPGGPMIRPHVPGQPIIVYSSPRPVRRRRKEYDEETIVVDMDSDESSDDESRRGGRRGGGRRQEHHDDGRSQLRKKHDELYRDDDGVYRRQKDRDSDRDRHSGDHRDRDRHSGDHRDRDRHHSRSETPKKDRASPGGVYRTGNKDERRIRNSVQDRVLGDHSRRS